MKVSLLKKGYIFTKNNYTIYFSGGRYFFNSLYQNESSHTLKDLKLILKKNHNINL